MNKILLYFSTLLVIVSSASKWYDGPSRPYEFGYKLENNQHRFEKKDDNGIIMGEFGFITADGVYHITVYATDENGNFKIVSMKNIKLEGLSPSFEMTPPPLKSSQTEAPRTTTSPPPPPPPITSPPKLQFAPKTDPPKFGCSNCVIPEMEVTKFQVTKDVGTPGSPASTGSGTSGPSSPSGSSDPNEANVISQQGHQTSGGAPTQSQGGGQAPQGHQQSHQTTSGGGPLKQPTQSQGGGQAPQGHQTSGGISPTQSQGGGLPQQGQQVGEASPNQPTQSQGGEGAGQTGQEQQGQSSPSAPAGPKGSSSPTSSGPGFVPNRFNSNGSPSPNGGNTPSSQGNNKNESPPNKSSSPSSTGGQGGSSTGGSGNNNSPSSQVPSAEQMKQMLGELLYKFNYTVGYHGHNEQGDRDGRKEGSYYQVGRDGLRRVVNYKANEFGYQPTITLEKATPEETPDPETERENRRHDYSFKWFFKSFE